MSGMASLQLFVSSISMILMGGASPSLFALSHRSLLEIPAHRPYLVFKSNCFNSFKMESKSKFSFLAVLNCCFIELYCCQGFHLVWLAFKSTQLCYATANNQGVDIMSSLISID